MMEFFRSLLRDFDFKKSLKYQAKLSLLVLLAFFSYYFLVFDRHGKSVAIIGVGEDQKADKESVQAEIPWEVLVVDPGLRSKLWAKFEKSDEDERENAYKAVIVMIMSIKEEQGRVLAEGFVKKDGDTQSAKHLAHMLAALEKLGIHFRTALPRVAAFSAKILKADSAAGDLLVRAMLKNIRDAVKDSPLRFCLGAIDSKTSKDCAREMTKKKDPEESDHVWNHAIRTSDPDESRGMLSVLADKGDERPKTQISRLLESRDSEDMQLAFQLIRTFGMAEYSGKLNERRKNQLSEKTRDDLEMTLQYLSTTHRSPGNTKD